MNCQYLIILVLAHENFATRVSWVWGTGALESQRHGSVADRFPDHGFIELSVENEFLSISTVKRPPSYLYPDFLPFCSKLLPAAVSDLLTVSGGVEQLEYIHVDIESGLYAMAACRCYVRLMVAMNVTSINQFQAPPESSENISDFCNLPDLSLSLEGRFTRSRPPTIPTVDKGYNSALGGASYFVHNGSVYPSSEEFKVMNALW
jgi:hypothetical protein